jgi:hypothetical protein
METVHHTRVSTTVPPLSQSAQLAVKYPMEQFRALMQQNDEDERRSAILDDARYQAVAAAAINFGNTDGTGNADDNVDGQFGVKRRKLSAGGMIAGGENSGSASLPPSSVDNSNISSNFWGAQQGLTNPMRLQQWTGVQGHLPDAQTMNLPAEPHQMQQEQQLIQDSTTTGLKGDGPTPPAQPDTLLGIHGLGSTASNSGNNQGNQQNSNSNVSVQDTSTSALQQLFMQNQLMMAAATNGSANGMSNIHYGNSSTKNAMQPGGGGGMMMFPHHPNQMQMMFQNPMAAYGIMSQNMGLPFHFTQQQQHQSGNLMVPVGMLPPPSALGIAQIGGNIHPKGGLSTIVPGGTSKDATPGTTTTTVHPKMNSNETASRTTSTSVDLTTMKGRRPLSLFMSCDDESLSEYQCLVRKQIELFEARAEDVESNAKGRNKPIVLGQVGIRCRHCSTLSPKSRSRGATYYPAKLNGLYQAAQSMASGHLCYHCQHIPNDIRKELLVLRERKSSAGGGKKYWGDGVRILGVIEDESGLRYKR